MEFEVTDKDMKVLEYSKRTYFDPGYIGHGEGTRHFSFRIEAFNPQKVHRAFSTKYFVYKTKIKLLKDSRIPKHNQEGMELTYDMPHKIWVDALALLVKDGLAKLEGNKCIVAPLGLEISFSVKVQKGNAKYFNLEVTPAKQNTTVESEGMPPKKKDDHLESFHSKFREAFPQNDANKAIKDQESFTDDRLLRLFKLFHSGGNYLNDELIGAYNAFISLLDHWKIRTPDSLKELERLTREKYPKG